MAQFDAIALDYAPGLKVVRAVKNGLGIPGPVDLDFVDEQYGKLIIAGWSCEEVDAMTLLKFAQAIANIKRVVMGNGDGLVTLKEFANLASGATAKTMQNIATEKSAPLPKPVQPHRGNIAARYNYGQFLIWADANWPDRARTIPRTFAEAKLKIDATPKKDKSEGS